MNSERIKWFEMDGLEFLKECTGNENCKFLYWNAGRYQYFRDEEEQQDDGEGRAYILQFIAHIPEGSDLDTDYFAKELVKRYCPLYVHRCHCEHDCCGHYSTINMDIYHKKLKYISDGRDVHRWTILIHNAINL